MVLIARDFHLSMVVTTISPSKLIKEKRWCIQHFSLYTPPTNTNQICHLIKKCTNNVRYMTYPRLSLSDYLVRTKKRVMIQHIATSLTRFITAQETQPYRSKDANSVCCAAHKTIVTCLSSDLRLGT